MRFTRLGPTFLIFALYLVFPAAPVDADVVLPRLMGSVRLGSQFIPCARKDEHLVISRDSHLDPRCTYTGGVEIVSSNVLFDCRGALIDDPEGDDDYGVDIHSSISTPIRRVTVRNCYIQGFRNNLRVSRDGFRRLAAGAEYRNGFARIELRNSRLLGAREVGVLVNPYVTDVRLRDIEVAGSGDAGIYLEGGSRENEIVRSHIHDNGYGDVDSVNGIPFFIAETEFRYLSTGREGLAIDGSRDNYISDNHFENNSSGAIFLYKNCGEFVNQLPGRWWPRRYGANGNRIRHNTIVNERTGVWVGSRMSENQLFFDCSDEPYVDAGLLRIHEDFAKDNAVLNNEFVDVATAIRIEDDGARVERNRIESQFPDHVAILVGTGRRTEVLGKPVTRATIRSNRTNIFLSRSAYLWVFEVDNSQFVRNRLNGSSALFHQGFPPTGNFHLFVERLWLP